MQSAWSNRNNLRPMLKLIPTTNPATSTSCEAPTREGGTQAASTREAPTHAASARAGSALTTSGAQQRKHRRGPGLGIAALTAALTLAACSVQSTGSDNNAIPSPAGPPTGTVTVVTHDSWNVDEQVLAAFEERTGITLKFHAAEGSLPNQLILTKDAPLGDVAYGVERASVQRTIDEGVFVPYQPTDLATSITEYAPDGSNSVVAIDFGDVCVNADRQWFAQHNLEIPQTFEDLIEPQYKGLLVVTHPGTSASGLSFLMASVASQGEEGWQDYWRALKANDVRVADGWGTAYYTDFSGSDGKGPRPLVVSYSSSPAYTVPDDAAESTTVNLDQTCFREVEYAGLLAGAKNPEAAKLVLDWLVSDEFQGQIADNMYMYPARAETEVPAWLADHGPAAANPWDLPARELTDNREAWISQWSEIFS